MLVNLSFKIKTTTRRNKLIYQERLEILRNRVFIRKIIYFGNGIFKIVEKFNKFLNNISLPELYVDEMNLFDGKLS